MVSTMDGTNNASRQAKLGKGMCDYVLDNE